MITEKLKDLKITSWCIENKTSIYVFTIMITLAGLVAYIQLPKEQFPDVVIPTISVATIYPGATPDDIENLITKPLEKQLKSINGIKKVTSNSLSDFSLIIAEFNTSMEPRLCKQLVSDAVDRGKKDLPTDLTMDPQIQEFDIAEVPIMSINLSGDLPLDELENYGEALKDKIESLSEITRVDIVGGLEREIQINVDLYKLTAAGLGLSDIEYAVARENLNISSGEIVIGDLRRNLRITGEFKTPEEIGNIVVRSFLGNEIVIKDIATVVDGYKDRQDFARMDGKPVVTLNIIKRAGENLINASDKIYEIVADYQKTQFPEELVVTFTGDTSEFTRIQIHDLINTVIIGFLMVVIILMFFMGFTNAFFVALSVPLASLIAFLLMPGFDMTLNVVVLFSFLLALGIIVDDAIVVIENTHRIFHKYDYPIAKSAKLAAGEVFIPVLSGTLTTLAPFFPLLLWPGIVGQFMKHLPVTLIITLFASLFVAFVMNPVFAVSFMKKDDEGDKKLSQLKKPMIWLGALMLIGYIIDRGIGNLFLLIILLVLFHHYFLGNFIKAFQHKFFPSLMNAYRKTIRSFTKGYRPIAVTLGAFALMIFSFVILIMFGPATTFFPTAEPNFVYVYAKLPMGTDALVTDSITKKIEERVYKVIGEDNPIVSSVTTNVGLGAGDPMNPDRVATPHKSKVTVSFVKFSDRDGASTAAVLDALRDEFKSGVAGAELSVEQEASGPPTGKPVNIEITGEDFVMLASLQEELKLKIKEQGVQGIVELKSDLQITKPEIIIDINREKAQREGISLGQIAMELRSALFGKEISKFRDAEDDAPIMIRLEEKYRDKVEELMNLNISFMDMATGQFRQVPISSIATVRYDNGINVINRKNQLRMVTLGSNVLEGYDAIAINAQVDKIIKSMSVPEGYTVALGGGEQEQQAETMNFMALAFPAAMALMLLILVTQFNSIIKPLMILTTVLFSFIGVFLGFTITQMEFSSVMTGVGIFSLSGIVIRNGILLLDFIEEMRKRGLNIYDAIVEGGATRLTPVILTAMAAMFGLVPLAIGLNIDFVSLFRDFNPKFFLGGDQVAFWGPLAWTMIFGLFAATFLTLLVLPTMYMLGYKTKHRVLGWFGKGNRVNKPKVDEAILDSGMSS